MFLGLGLLAFGLVPRASSALAYGLLAAAFVWELFGSLLGASHWLVQLTPFQHVGLVPGQAIRLGDGALMLAVALASSLLAWRTFARRDLVGS
jgi:ABC-2 type transport system permease protein